MPGDRPLRTVPELVTGASSCRRSAPVLPWLWLILAVSSLPAQARVVEAGPDDYRRALAVLEPGDELRLAPGDYLDGLPIHGLNGRTGLPIVIAGSANGVVSRFLARRGANTVSIRDSSHVVVRNLLLDGRGLPVDGLKCEGNSGPVHHLVVENLRIVGHGVGQQVVGISTKCTAWGWEIRDNLIEAAGTGMYLGDSDGTAPFIAGLIEGNVIVDSVGYNLQVKHQLGQLPLPGLGDGPHQTIIRRNVFSKARNGSVGGAARPNLLLGHWPREGPGADDVYLVYGNFFYQNPTERLLQVEGNVAIYGNLFVNHSGDAIRIQPHNDIPREIWVFHNSVVARETGVSATVEPGTRHLSVIGNAVFAAEPIGVTHTGGTLAKLLARIQGRLTLDRNVTGSLDRAAAVLTDPWGALGTLDLYPVDEALDGSEAVADLMSWFTEADRDFNGRRRAGRFRGAYAGAGRNPGWKPSLSRIPAASPTD